MLFFFVLSSCGGGGGGSDAGGGVITPQFNAQVSNAPADGATISGTVRLEVTGTEIENVELLPQSGYTPKYAIFTVSGDKTKATVDFDTTKLSNGILTVRISAFNAASGEIIAMTARNWNIDNDQNPVPSIMTMDCAEGAGYQCSGSEILQREHGVALTRSGVQVYGKSTIDDITTASGLELASSGKADIRLRKNGGYVSNPVLLLSDMEITWDGQNERPIIIETFDPTQGRNELDSQGRVVSVDLPPVTDLEFYDYARLERSAAQEHYANNRYFPRSEPSRCDSGDCPTAETSGVLNDANGGINHASAIRLHEDGDIHAGNALDGGPLLGGTGPGVPFPGSKGYRSLENWSYQYGNLAAWLTQDTVEISEWLTVGGVEHNQNRRGMIAFGDVTLPSSVPNSGSAIYSGVVYGWQSPGNLSGTTFRGTATITVDFATRDVNVTIEGVPTGTIVANTKLGAAGSDNENYLNAEVDNGGLGGRLFGPASGSAPPELGGVFSLPGTSGRSAVIGGFIARRQ